MKPIYPNQQMSEAPDIAAAFISKQIETLNEKQWETFLDYLQDKFPKEYGDADRDKLEKLSKRQVAVWILEKALGIDKMEKQKKSFLPQYDQNLAKEWQEKQNKPVVKRARDADSLLEDFRREISINTQRLPSFNRVVTEWTFQQFSNVVKDDTLGSRYGIRVPSRLFAELSGKLIELFNQTSLQRIYVRAIDFTNNEDVLFVSGPAYAQLLAPNKVIVNTFQAPANEQIDNLHFVYDGNVQALEQNRASLETELSDVLSTMPALSRGMRLSTPTGGTVVVDKLEAAGEERFAVAMPQYGLLDIPYTIDPFEANIGLCDNDACGEKATHVCSRCRVAVYCDKEICREIGWHQHNHKLICGLFV